MKNYVCIRWTVLLVASLFGLSVSLLTTSAQAKPRTIAERIAGDLASGRDVVITSYVALWRPPASPPKPPKPDLYWGALYGHDTFFVRRESLDRHLPFLRVDHWNELGRHRSGVDPVAVKVMTAPAATVIRHAARHAGNLVVVYLAYLDRSRAAHDMTIHLKSGRPPALGRDQRDAMERLASSYVVGYWGHNVYHDGYNPDRLERLPVTARDRPRGVFVIGCQTAIWYPQKFLGSGIEPVLFTTNKMAPEAYLAAALYDGLARALDKRALRRHVIRALQAYHHLSRPPVRLFVNTREQIARYQAPLGLTGP